MVPPTLAIHDAALGQNTVRLGGDKTITRVVKMLQKMAAKSEAEGESERVLYAKFKCYCDTSNEEKTNAIAKYTEDIELLGSDIQALKGDTGGLSRECAKLKAGMEANEQEREEAEAIRTKEAEEFASLKEDLEMAIGQITQAVSTLAEIGADQSLGKAAADHSQFMSGNQASLLRLGAQVRGALAAAAAMLPPAQKQSVEAFVQAPFTGSYSAQSGAVVGILKNMKDTFSTNLEAATTKEESASKSHKEFMDVKEEEYATMKASYDSKQEVLTANDEELATKKTQLTAAVEGKSEAEEFLAALTESCDKKAAEYEKRTLLRTNEQAAIAKAIAILNSDEAFSTFAGVSATSKGPKSGGTGLSFLQRGASSRLAATETRRQAQALMVAASRKHGASAQRLLRVARLLRAGNPFAVVLKEIAEMQALIEKEAKQDKKKLTWCKAERRKGEATIQEKTDEIDLKTGYTQEREDVLIPEVKRKIEEAKLGLDENRASQVSQTTQRKEENLAYQKDIANLVQAEDLLERAIEVLKKYYDSLDMEASGTGFVQMRAHGRDLPTPPDTWDSYGGQSSGGGDAIMMLQFIYKQTKKEESVAHEDEHTAQHEYEDSMTSLKDEEKDLEKSITKLTMEKATLEEELETAKTDLAEAIKDKEAMEAYLVSIKKGCDFIVEHYDLRETNRLAESSALEEADKLLRNTPTFQAAAADAHEKSLGACAEVCGEVGEEHAKCKACLADVTVPGYCAGHKRTPGCDEAGGDTETSRLK